MRDYEYVDINYTNWRGERGVRRIIPRANSLRFDATEYHPSPQWLFDAWDVQKMSARTFAMKDVHSWTPVAVSLSSKGDAS